MGRAKFVIDFSGYICDEVKEFCKEKNIKYEEDKKLNNTVFISFVKKNLKQLHEDYFSFYSGEILKYEPSDTGYDKL